MKNLCVLALIFLALGSHAQTKLIAHKSHGGSVFNFEAAMEHESPLMNSNFGQAPIEIVTDARLDSVIYINDSTVVMVTSRVAVEYRKNQRIMSSNDCGTRDENNWPVWNPGRDTVLHHEVFSSGTSVEKMRQIIGGTYFFNNQPEDIHFEGFERKEAEEQEKDGGISPLGLLGSDHRPTAASIFLIGLCVLWIFRTWKSAQPHSALTA